MDFGRRCIMCNKKDAECRCRANAPISEGFDPGKESFLWDSKQQGGKDKMSLSSSFLGAPSSMNTVSGKLSGLVSSLPLKSLLNDCKDCMAATKAAGAPFLCAKCQALEDQLLPGLVEKPSEIASCTKVVPKTLTKISSSSTTESSESKGTVSTFKAVEATHYTLSGTKSTANRYSRTSLPTMAQTHYRITKRYIHVAGCIFVMTFVGLIVALYLLWRCHSMTKVVSEDETVSPGVVTIGETPTTFA